MQRQQTVDVSGYRRAKFVCCVVRVEARTEHRVGGDCAAVLQPVSAPACINRRLPSEKEVAAKQPLDRVGLLGNGRPFATGAAEQLGRLSRRQPGCIKSAPDLFLGGRRQVCGKQVVLDVPAASERLSGEVT